MTNGSGPEAARSPDGPRAASLIAEGEARLAHAGIPAARLEAEVLLARRLGSTRARLILHGGEPVDEAAASAYRADLERRALRYPLQYLTGVQEFYSLEFEVDERVLIPRPETEMIVDEVLRITREDRLPPSGDEVRPPIRIVDVGTGSGCIAVAIAKSLADCAVLAIDLSEGALEVARRNAARHAVEDRVRFVRGDGLAPALAAADFVQGAEFVVSNPPYIDEADLAGLQPELHHEPRIALTPGPDGLAFTARLVSDAARAVRSGGWLLVELSCGRSEQARQLLPGSLWRDVGVKPDLQGIPRLLLAQRR